MRYAAILIMAILALSLIAGCGQSTTTQTSEDQPNQLEDSTPVFQEVQDQFIEPDDEVEIGEMI